MSILIQPRSRLADYVYLGTTQSLCPDCLGLVPAKIVSRRGRVYFHKRCPNCGPRDDFVCSDVSYYDRMEYSVPGKIPVKHGVAPEKGCPYDCGLCTQHEQHTCIALVEVNSNCNLNCPMCFASSGPGGQNLSFEQCRQSIDRIVEVEGHAEVVQLSGGEPTIHPDFVQILRYAVSQPIDYVQINTNGVRLANDEQLIDELARHRDRIEVFYQLDGLDPECTVALRGEDLLSAKLRAIDRLGQADIHITLAATLQPGVNDDQYGSLLNFAIDRPFITGINFQPATYSGRCVLPEELEKRITFPDVVKGICGQSDSLFVTSDFMPLPCAHPNCHIISLGYRHGNQITPIARMFNVAENLDLLANGISFTKTRSGELIEELVRRCCSSCSSGNEAASQNPYALATGNGSDTDPELTEIASKFLAAAVNNELTAKDLFRITITSFLDVYNFDVRRLMKCCTHHVLPSGHVIPFCAYNVLYREGHVELPHLTDIETQPE